MSICSESYWFYFNDNQASPVFDKGADPTETIVEWLVEMKSGQQEAFSKNQNNTDSKSEAKTFAFHIDLLQEQTGIRIACNASPFIFQKYISELESISSEIISPPPDYLA